MSRQSDEMRRELERIFDAFPHIHASDIPGIDLYMDQVTTFLDENLRGISGDPDDGKLLTKTMINNYVKSRVLFPPVKKKYSREHMMFLIMIYYMKSFLSIGEIRSITAPVIECCVPAPAERGDRKKESADKKAAEKRAAEKKTAARPDADPATAHPAVREVYEEIVTKLEDLFPEIQRNIEEQIDQASSDFPDVPEQDRELLQRFSLICRLSLEVYMRKLFIEKLLEDSER